MDHIVFLSKIFDYVRVVDPDERHVDYAVGDDHFHVISHGNCYDVWQRKKVCDNCISIRAVQENKTKVKFEMTSGRTFLVIAAPYDDDGKRKSVELIKDVTENNIFDFFDSLEQREYSEIIEDLNQYIITDELTQVFNKRFVQEHLPIDIKNAYFEKTSLSIVMADIDFFKDINDNYGHVSGDEILAGLGLLFKKSIRGADDWVARYGGEEFIFVFKGLNTEVLIGLCERIRLSVENHVFLIKDESIKLTISLGGLILEEAILEDDKTLIDQADQLLYKAKNSGRNKSVVEQYKKE